MALSEDELTWSAPTSGKTERSKADSKTPAPIASVPATVGQARLDVMVAGDPTHAHSLLKWTSLLRADKSWTDLELAEGFLGLTERISQLQQELQAMDLQAPGAPWLEMWRKSQRLSGKRDAIMDELKNRGKAKAIYFRRGGNMSEPGSEPPSEAKAPESDPFVNC